MPVGGVPACGVPRQAAPQKTVRRGIIAPILGKSEAVSLPALFRTEHLVGQCQSLGIEILRLLKPDVDIDRG
jgi:hypothetical protein